MLVVQVMREVKLREEEYTSIKDLANRIRGLPDVSQLVRRERRLLAHGPLQMVHLSERSRQQLETNGYSKPNARATSRSRSSRHRRANSVDSGVSSELSAASSTSSISSKGADDNYRADYLRDETKKTPSWAGATKAKISVRRATHSDDEVSPQTSKLTSVHAFVFTDLILFAAPVSRRSEDPQFGWQLLDDIGLCRILALTDYSGHTGIILQSLAFD